MRVLLVMHWWLERLIERSRCRFSILEEFSETLPQDLPGELPLMRDV